MTGALFLAGIALNSLAMTAGATLGVAIGTVAAALLHYEKKEIERGLYGFNACLVGIACAYFFGLNPLSIAAIAAGAVFSTVVMRATNAKIKPFTAPFVLATWAALALEKKVLRRAK